MSYSFELQSARGFHIGQDCLSLSNSPGLLVPMRPKRTRLLPLPHRPEILLRVFPLSRLPDISLIDSNGELRVNGRSIRSTVINQRVHVAPLAVRNRSAAPNRIDYGRFPGPIDPDFDIVPFVKFLPHIARTDVMSTPQQFQQVPDTKSRKREFDAPNHKL